MMKKAILGLGIFFVALTCLTVDVENVFAQSVGIKISPTRVDEMVEPGEKMYGEVKVTNESAVDKKMYVYLKDFKSEDESGVPTLIAPGSEEGYYLASWIDITSDGIDFSPGEEISVPYVIEVPADIGPGGYYGGIYFGTEPPRLNFDSEDKGAGMAIAQQAGSLILLQVKGDIDEHAEIREFNTDKEVYGTPFDVKFIVRIENHGNVHVKPYGAVTIKNMFGREKAMVRVNEKQGNILPASIRRFEENWSGKFGFGRYVATIGLTYGTSVDKGGNGKQSITTEKIFWIMPWKIIVPTILGAVILILIFVLLLKLYKNKAVKKAMQQAGMGRVKFVKQYKGPSPVLHLALIMFVVFIVLLLLITVVYFLFFA